MNSTSLSYFSTPKKQPAEQGVPLYVNGKSITSLHELRTHTKPNDLYPLLHNHSLLHWLVAQGREETAYSLACLLRTINFPSEFERILGFPSEHNHELSENEIVNFENRKEYLREFTNNEVILSDPYTVALNQTELHEILFLGATKVYLCSGIFRIPLSIPNVRYIGIGGAVIQQPLSQEEYLSHKIKIMGIPLPLAPANPLVTRANFGASIRIPSFLSSKLSENQ